MNRLSQQEWIALASHRLARRWRHVSTEQLDEVASDLYQNKQLRELEPNVAAESWLAPLDESSAINRA